MYNNKPERFNREEAPKFERDVEFTLSDQKRPSFKTITTKTGEQRDLLEFWVVNGNEEVRCVIWNEAAHRLNEEIGDHSKIIISYKEVYNKFNGKIGFSVREFKLV